MGQAIEQNPQSFSKQQEQAKQPTKKREELSDADQRELEKTVMRVLRKRSSSFTESAQTISKPKEDPKANADMVKKFQQRIEELEKEVKDEMCAKEKLEKELKEANEKLAKEVVKWKNEALKWEDHVHKLEEENRLKMQKAKRDSMELVTQLQATEGMEKEMEKLAHQLKEEIMKRKNLEAELQTTKTKWREEEEAMRAEIRNQEAALLSAKATLRIEQEKSNDVKARLGNSQQEIQLLKKLISPEKKENLAGQDASHEKDEKAAVGDESKQLKQK